MHFRRVPRTEEELLRRAQALAGRTLSSLGSDAHKGGVGNAIERALGLSGQNHAGPDARLIGVEVKTLPMDPQGRVLESTWVGMANPSTLAEETWGSSGVWAKLRRVLFVPVGVVGADADVVVGAAFLWSPSQAQHDLLRADWEDLADLLVHGVEVSARRGVALQLRPKARDATVRTTAVTVDGDSYAHAPRGFYLRTTFTQAIVDAAFHEST